MDRTEALEILRDGHTVWKVETAQEVCEVLGVPFKKSLAKRFKSDNHPLGLTMRPGYEDTEGVYSLSLSQYVAEKLGVADQAGSYLGRGTQARAYAEAVAKVA